MQLLKVGQRQLQNRYFVIRHGESTANVAGLISSTYKVAITNHGLTSRGIEQAQASAKTLLQIASTAPGSVDSMDNTVSSQSKAMLQSRDDVVFYASDFARAYETAYHCRATLKDLLPKGLGAVKPKQRPTPAFFTTASLRERSFGIFEGNDHTNYANVWEKDAIEPISSTHFESESIASVLDRVIKLVNEIEDIYQDKIIVFVSHGDVCQITQTAFMSLDGRQHRSLPHMNNCDVRELLIDTSL